MVGGGRMTRAEEKKLAAWVAVLQEMWLENKDVYRRIANQRGIRSSQIICLFHLLLEQDTHDF